MKLKFRQSAVELYNNSNQQFDISIVFSFNNSFLPCAKKHIPNVKLNTYDDLSQHGSFAVMSEQKILVISLSDKNQLTLAAYRKALDVAINYLKNKTKVSSFSLVCEDYLSRYLNLSGNEYIESTMFFVLSNLYSFEELKSQQKQLNLKQINFITPTQQKQLLENALVLTNGLTMLKDLANSPANIVTPRHLAKVAKSLESLSPKAKVEVLDEKETKKLKMGALLAVAQGSNEEVKFIKMEYYAAAKNKKPIVFIGKGITFDSGGISIKPSRSMDKMKFDMCGAATVIAIFQTVIQLQLPINLVCLAPTCENLPSGSAIKPGDVVKSMSGKTIEIVNTDAEGRLILCDALTYAKKYNPELVIDIATLTGACIIALGSIASGLYCNDNVVADKLIKSSVRTGDKIWQMPLFNEYHEMLKGTVADLKNIGSWDGAAGSVTAACFLEKFTDYKWAHLDIAGTSTQSNSSGGELASGRPFYLLMDFIRNHKY